MCTNSETDGNLVPIFDSGMFSGGSARVSKLSGCQWFYGLFRAWQFGFACFELRRRCFPAGGADELRSQQPDAHGRGHGQSGCLWTWLHLALWLKFAMFIELSWLDQWFVLALQLASPGTRCWRGGLPTRCRLQWGRLCPI